MQLGGLGLGGTGHAGELVVEPEVVLQRDRGERLVLGLDLDVLLGLDGLVHALVVAAAEQHAAGELVDDEHLAVADDVVLVALVELLGLDRVVQVADQRRVRGLVEVVDAELVLDELDARPRARRRCACGCRPRSGRPSPSAARAGRTRRTSSTAPSAGPGDDQRGAGLVDEDRVDLVDDGEVVAALHHVLDGCAMLSRR